MCVEESLKNLNFEIFMSSRQSLIDKQTTIKCIDVYTVQYAEAVSRIRNVCHGSRSAETHRITDPLLFASVALNRSCKKNKLYSKFFLIYYRRYNYISL
jgi:hypothetical protein